MNNKSNFRRGSVELLISRPLQINRCRIYFRLQKQVGRRQVNVYYHLEDSGRTHLQQLLEDYYATANAIQQVLKYTVTQ